ncbi:chemotaxis protein CheA [Desulfovibrio sp. 86]|uniref:Chemotaxis protein CheA n=1 Tax=uncultured Desulfovibrio sp. TaxID=167968 RepID=A0A212KXT2_9BACT|nr:chemotaxis protein CheA [Desulfovibrio sp. 86]SCM70111.1 CheA signal transduction histidine kinase [uncultured Desulfovibrio sp.]VZH35405.1 CheA signal transduction histidine kinase [Desulfovibrio sp. 86]
MSQDFFDPELFADFIAEAKEHLETIEPNLLELEKAPGNLALLNDIFRPMHSLKGASGFLGLNRINQLAHKAENILDELRKGSMVVTSEIMDVILASTDALRQMIDNLEANNSEGEVETGHIMAQIDAIMAGDSPALNPPVAAAPVETVAETVAAPVVADVQAQGALPAETGVEGASASELPQDVQADSASAPDNASGMSGKEWVGTLPEHEPYALTAFGEGHLKDFIDESIEIIENLTNGLLELEENPTGQNDLVNDLFRFFHNMKGNSGIIGYNELNALTHEAETLLNNVRQGKITPTHDLIDLLLLVVDVMEALVRNIDIPSGQATPFETDAVVRQLQAALAGGPIALPEELLAAQGRAHMPAEEPRDSGTEAADQASSVEVVTPTIIPVGSESDDTEAFRVTVQQQIEIIHAALETLKKNGSHKDSIDALFRCLVAIKNACAFVGLADIKTYAERTAGIVDQGRISDIDFGLMIDLLSQEVSIIEDMIHQALAEGKVAADVCSSAEKAVDEKDETDSPVQAPGADHAQPKTFAMVASAAPAQASQPVASREGQNLAVKPAAAAPPVAPASPARTAAPAAQPAPAAAMARPAAPQTKGAAPAAENHKSSSTIRVDHERLDHLMNLIGELIINRNRYTLIARSLEDSSEKVDISHVAQSLSETTYAMARISDDLQDTIMKVRMVPVSSVFSRFPRLVRDLSRKSGKEVDLIMEGEETELDKSVVEVIGDPLVHLIRNSVDHGIEPEDVRIAAGKPPKGKVTLRAFHKGNSVAIEIEDDGKGIDPVKMREIAVRKGLITADEAAQLDDREAIELIFAPGFSSADQITDISGRGVGMDVVRTNIKNLKGSVSTHSEVGKGTRFTLSLPLTLAIIDALMVNVSGQMYAIPLDAVSETTKIEAHRLTDVKGRKAVTLRGEVLGIVEMAEMLGLPRASDPLPEVLSVVVIHDNDRRLGLVVDRLLERQEIVIKPLGAYLGDLKGISGATIMGDGSVILILDPHEIYLMATSKAASMAPPAGDNKQSASSARV